MYKLNGIILFLIFTISFIPSATAEDLDLTIVSEIPVYKRISHFKLCIAACAAAEP